MSKLKTKVPPDPYYMDGRGKPLAIGAKVQHVVLGHGTVNKHLAAGDIQITFDAPIGKRELFVEAERQKLKVVA